MHISREEYNKLKGIKTKKRLATTGRLCHLKASARYAVTITAAEYYSLGGPAEVKVVITPVKSKKGK